MTLTPADCMKELSADFSNEMIPKFREVYHFFKKHAVDKDSLIRKLHLGYTAMRPEAFDFAAEEFPWLEDFRVWYGLSKRLNFLETHGIEKPEFKLHIDGKPGCPHVMLNVPILNCTTETTTYWVEPRHEYETHLSCEDGTNSEKKSGATPHLPEGAEYDVICEYSFTDRIALFRSDIFHGVKNNTQRDEYRILMHWWFPDHFPMEKAVVNFA